MQEPNLRATQYLPDIVRLQCYLYDTFNFHLDRRKAMSTTIGQFIQQMSKSIIANYYYSIFAE